MKESWNCPFCNHTAIIQDGSAGTVTTFNHVFNDGNKYKEQYIRGVVIVCPNDKCSEFTLTIELLNCIYRNSEFRPTALRRKWRLIPDSTAKIFPSYIPEPLLDDYREACLIRDLSPKASATLARRCLQGMIRHFWGVSKSRLVDEIDGIKDKVADSTWEAIDSVRQVGNIGAHMERDINLVIDVDPEEAQLLIELIETLFADWYVARNEREERMKKVKALATTKDEQKKLPAK